TQWIFQQIFNAWYDPEAGRARPIEELVAAFEAGTRTPVAGSAAGTTAVSVDAVRAANPAGLPWAELDPVARRRVVDAHRLAYISEQLVNWCPGLGTVLANEEVTAEGRSDIGNYPVFRRPLRQWTLRITAYAERLMADLDLVDWPDSIKQMQRNWIGPSDGARVTFPAWTGAPDGPPRPAVALEVYTTRPDTLPGATFMVLAPEHPLVDALTAAAWPADTRAEWKFEEGRPEGVSDAEWTPAAAVAAYRDFAGKRSDRQRGEEVDRTGVFTGAYARNPVTDKPIPIFLADYVLLGYGTGAVMAVPAH